MVSTKTTDRRIFEFAKLFKIPWRETALSLTFGILIIILLTRFTNAGKVLGLLLSFPTKLSFLVLFFLLIYFLLKFTLSRYLLKSLGFPFTFKRMLIIFGAGELARELPVGLILFTIIFASRPKTFPLSFFAAGLIQPYIEVFSAVFLVSVFGFGKVDEVRLAAIVLMVVMIIFLVLVRYLSLPKFLTPQKDKQSLWGRIKIAAAEIKYGIDTLLSWPILLKSFPLATLYLSSLAIVLFWIARSVGAQTISIFDAIPVYAFSFFWAMISPIPIDLGVTETAGFLSLSAFGVGREEALATMIATRIIVSGFSWLVFGTIFWILFSEIREFVNQKRGKETPVKPS